LSDDGTIEAKTSDLAGHKRLVMRCRLERSAATESVAKNADGDGKKVEDVKALDGESEQRADDEGNEN